VPAATGGFATPVLQRVPRSPVEATRVPIRVAPRVPVAPPVRVADAQGSNGHAAAAPAAQALLPAPSPFPDRSAPPDAALLAALPMPAEGAPFVARPAPTRTAVMAAFSHAVERVPVVAPPPPVTPARDAIAPLMRSPLSRVETGSSPPREEAPAAESPDLDAIADFVLERLRHELRDGRERLGFLLDDMR
jgi:hypothetical protein